MTVSRKSKTGSAAGSVSLSYSESENNLGNSRVKVSELIKIQDGPGEIDIAEAQQTNIDDGIEDHASEEDNGNWSEPVYSQDSKDRSFD